MTTGPAPDRLLRDWLGAIAADLVAPIFEGGRIRAEIAEAEALEAQQLHAYAAVALTALREVEDAWVREARAAEALTSLEARIALARAAWERLRVRYASGDGGYLELVSALDGVQALQRAHVDARRDRLLHRVALYRALAGPLDIDTPWPPPASPADVEDP